jgi:HAD superfamily hydrolase (TIGR01549 family)
VARPFDLISFDFDGVILHNTFNDYYLNVLREMNITWDPVNELTLFRFFHNYWASDLSREEAAIYTRDDFWKVVNRRFLDKLGVPDSNATDALLLRLVQAFGQSTQFVDYYKETVLENVLEGLHSAGYRVVMITNRGDSVNELLEEWELRHYFEMVVDRDTAGIPKPYPAPFLHVNTTLDIAPHRSLHIGDSPYSDVQGAQNAGWTPLLIDPDNLFPDWEVAKIRTLGELPLFLEDTASFTSNTNLQP